MNAEKSLLFGNIDNEKKNYSKINAHMDSAYLNHHYGMN